MNFIARILIALIVSGIAAAQVNTAKIVGTVRDISGATVAGGKVTVRNTQTGLLQATTTAAEGNYTFDGLPSGPYAVSVSMTGFKTAERKGVTLDATQHAKIDFSLEVGAVSESVEVTADAPQVNTQNTETGALIAEQQVRNLPLNGRNFSQLISLQPGSVLKSGGVFFNGLTRDGVNITVDGTDAANPDRPSTEDAGGRTRQNILSV
jgi:hypothetical protein